MNRNTWTRIRTGELFLPTSVEKEMLGDWLLEGPAGRLVITRALSRSLGSAAASSPGQSRLLFGSFATALIGSSVMSAPSLPASCVLVPGFRERDTTLCPVSELRLTHNPQLQTCSDQTKEAEGCRSHSFLKWGLLTLLPLSAQLGPL